MPCYCKGGEILPEKTHHCQDKTQEREHYYSITVLYKQTVCGIANQLYLIFRYFENYGKKKNSEPQPDSVSYPVHEVDHVNT